MTYGSASSLSVAWDSEQDKLDLGVLCSPPLKPQLETERPSRLLGCASSLPRTLLLDYTRTCPFSTDVFDLVLPQTIDKHGKQETWYLSTVAHEHALPQSSPARQR